MDKAPAARGTQDITVVWIIFILVVIGLVVGYWFMLYKPKTEEIQMTQSSIAQKTTTLKSYENDAKELLNYEDQFAVLVRAWNQNQHFFVNGLVENPPHSGKYNAPYPGREQWAIFDTLGEVWLAAASAPVSLQEMYISEKMKFYPNDQPFEVPDNLKGAIGWDPVMADRGENQNPMFISHNFSIKFFGTMENTHKFIEYLQKLKGSVTKVFSIHCFETSNKPAYRANQVGLTNVVLSSVTLEIHMFLSVYEMNPAALTPNAVPDLPGATSCSYGSAGGGGAGGGGGGGGPSTGGGGMGIGI